MMEKLTRKQAIQQVKDINDYIENFQEYRIVGTREDSILNKLGIPVYKWTAIYSIRDYLIWKFKLTEEEYGKRKND